ncbi:MAG: hypothetical protein QW404_01620 [Candidatus Nanoarchaeia archaeon]
MPIREVDLEELHSSEGVLREEKVIEYKKMGLEKLIKKTQTTMPQIRICKWQGVEVIELNKYHEMVRALYELGERKITAEVVQQGYELNMKPIKLKEARLLDEREYADWFSYLTI